MRIKTPKLQPMNRKAGKPATPSKTAPGEHPDAQPERLQKILARAGLASRRAAEELITAGRVTVNGKVVTELGTRADPSTDKIEVDGRPVASPSPHKSDEFVYIMLNKPLGVVSTAKDPQGRPTVIDLVTKDEGRRTKDDDGPSAKVTQHPTPITQHLAAKRLFPVGRLDADSTGLILLTNDGDLTFRLTHPRFGVEKEYHVLVRGRPSAGEIRKLREGIEIEGEMTAPAKVEEVGKRGDNSRLSVTIHEGKKRQVRLMCVAVGHPVIELERVRFGPLALGSLQQGKWRHLAVHEVHALQKAVRLRR
jgi:pseudouridine synthase